jgi:DNA replication protein DnaC
VATIEAIGNAFQVRLKTLIIETDEICEIHGEKKVSVKTPDGLTNPYCAVCLSIKSANDLSERVKKSVEADILRKTYKVLKRDSILSDETIMDAEFDNFNTDGEQEAQRAKQFAESVAAFYIAGGNGNTVLSGLAGTGKSHLAMSIAKAYNEACKESGEPKSVMFASWSQVLRKVKESFNYKESKDSPESLLNRLIDADLLILDDIGSEKVTDWSNELLTDLLDGRTRTIITSNLSSKKMQEIYKEPRIVSRILRGIGKRGFTFDELTDKRIIPF